MYNISGELITAMAELIQLIKEIAIDAISKDKPVEFVIGTVESVDPLRIKVNQFLVLESDCLIIPHYMQADTKYSFSLDRQKIQLTDLMTFETKEYEITANTQEVVSNYVFEPRDKILMLKFQGGQNFLLVSKLD